MTVRCQHYDYRYVLIRERDEKEYDMGHIFFDEYAIHKL